MRAAAGRLQADQVIGSTHYDMVNAPDEPYYATQYWTVIEPALAGLPEQSRSLDLGCSQGRFSYRLAERFPKGQVVGCDISAEAIRAASAGAGARGLGNVEFHCRDIAEQLRLCGERSADIIVMTEVTVFYPDWQNHMAEMARKLRPGGVLVMSFRSQYFDALCLVRGRQFEAIDLLLGKRRGCIFPPSLTEFSWQRSDEVRAELEKAGLNVVALQGIGACSGIPGDPHDGIARPSMLDAAQVSALMKLELELGRAVPDAGRYILAVGRKP